MTTVATDGFAMACDSLVMDNFGLFDKTQKVLRGKDFLFGGAGEAGQIQRWWKSVKHLSLEEVLDQGYPNYAPDLNEPSLVLASRGGIWRHAGSEFLKCSRPFHAIGSGRDFALAAMELKCSPKEAVRIAALFDNNTGGEILEYRQ